MLTVLVAIGAFVGYLVAYHTYGRWLARRIFQLDDRNPVPSKQLRDDVDYLPSRKEVVFGHHFTSIAGTGPIVGPAIAVFWGWLPALLWVLFGSIFIGAVHDFGSLIVSIRNRGQTVGEVAGRLITRRARILFLLILFFALTVVLAIFGLVIASIFAEYPEAVLSVWVQLPLAILVGWLVYKRGWGLLMPSLVALGVMYLAIWIGANWLPLSLPAGIENPVIVWTLALLVYCFVASVLPVWVLLQPRDFINSHQLMLAMGLLVVGLLIAGVTGKADLNSAPAVVEAQNIPAGAPPIVPFLFITIACGAISGFHCLVSSGTSSKQIAHETDAQYVGYGAMLLEGALAVLVILACCAGVGMGKFDRVASLGSGVEFQQATVDGRPLVGAEAWHDRYDHRKGWQAFQLRELVGAFVEGGANFLTAAGVPLAMAIGIMAVLVASFAATTLDTATRLQRYVVQELAAAVNIKPLTNKYAATLVAVALAGAMAMMPGPSGIRGTGGQLLWPLFGATNQLLAGLAFMVIAFYLWRRNKPVWFAIGPMVLMLILPAWALWWQMFNPETGFLTERNYLLLGIGGVALGLQAWMIVEGVLIARRAKGVLEKALPPLPVGSGQ